MPEYDVLQKNTVATTNKKKIRLYCDMHGVFVPAGFDRQSASRYAIIRNDAHPRKLVAKTWFNKEDVIYYIENSLQEEVDGGINDAVDILDFKDGQRLLYQQSGALVSDGSFAAEQA